MNAPEPKNGKEKKPAPGSKEAISQGCKCPVIDNGHGRGYMGQDGIYVFSGNCTLHTI